jgi:hypothetical protein
LEEVNPDIHWQQREWFYRISDPAVTEVGLSEILADPFVGVIYVAPVQRRVGGLETGYLYVAGVDETSLPPEYESFAGVFSEKESLAALPEHTRVRHSIPIEEGKSVPYGPIYPMSAEELRILREYLDDHLQKRWIQKSESPAGAPVLFTPKKDGKLRLCVDYRGLNRVTIKNRRPLPLIPEILDRLSRAKIFTKLDLKDAYHRIVVEESDRWKTAFRTRYGHYEYLVMPFGLTNAPATFQDYIDETLRESLDTIVIAFMDYL